MSDFSRRTVVRGAAWTVPVVAVATTAPAFAVSAGKVTFESLGIACKLPGASCKGETGVVKGYVVRVRVCSTFAFPTVITIRDAMVSLNGGTATLFEVGTGTASENCANVTTGTVADPDDPADIDPDIQKDVTLTFSGPGCCVVDFALEGEPNSQNVSLSGSAPFTYIVPGQVGPNASGSGTIPLTAASTPPCKDCAPETPAPAPAP